MSLFARLKPIILPTRIEKIDKNLYRGNAVFSPVKALRIKSRGVKQIIDLRNDQGFFVNPFKFLEKLYCKIFNIKYKNMVFHRSKTEKIPETDFFDSVNEQIKKGGKTYIHCHFGLHRTGFAIAMYQKSKKVAKDIIIKQLLKNSWERPVEKSDLNVFLQKFFNKKN